MGTVWLRCMTSVGPLRSVVVTATNSSTNYLLTLNLVWTDANWKPTTVAVVVQCSPLPSIDKASYYTTWPRRNVCRCEEKHVAQPVFSRGRGTACLRGLGSGADMV